MKFLREPKTPDVIRQFQNESIKPTLAFMTIMTLGVTAAFLSGAGKEAYPKGFSEGSKLAVIGDSLPAGLGVENGQAFPEIIGRNFGVEVENAAWSGADIDQITNGEGSRASQLTILNEDTSAVLMMFGGNDTEEQNVRELYHSCLSEGCDEGALAYSTVENSFNSQKMIDKYHNLFSETLERAPNAEVYFVGYYEPIKIGILAEMACRMASDDCSFYDNGGAKLASRAVKWLNSSAKSAMETIDSDRLHFIEAPDIGVLGDADIMQRLTTGNPTVYPDGYAALHLTAKGQEKIAKSIIIYLARQNG